MRYRDFQNQLGIFVDGGYFNPSTQTWFDLQTGEYTKQFDSISAAITYYNNFEKCPPETKSLGRIATSTGSDYKNDPLFSIHYKLNTTGVRGLGFLRFELIDDSKGGSFTIAPNALGYLFVCIGDVTKQEFYVVSKEAITVNISKDGTKNFYIVGYLGSDYNTELLYTPAQLTNLNNLKKI